jgi:hypothetical protein
VKVELLDVRDRLADRSLVREVDQLEKGHIRIETAFLYPEGGSVDLFIRRDDTLFPEIRLSDLGHTMQWLLDVQVRPWLSKKRQTYLEDVLRTFDVRQEGGALEAQVASLEDLPPAVVRLGQACVRVADLYYTRRSSLQVPVTEEVEEILAEGDLDYEPDKELPGRFGKPIRVDFLVQGRHASSAVLTWSSANTSQAHTASNEIFRRWYDLAIPDRKEQRVTIFDDRYDVYRDDDIKRLRNLSDVVGLSDRPALIDLLAA